MSEAEIVFHLSEIYDRAWALQQWWASISFGLLVLSHFASERLNLFLVLFLIGLYSGFSLVVWNILNRNFGTIQGYTQDLNDLVASGQALAAGTATYLEPHDAFLMLVLPVTLVSTFVGCIAYLVFAYISGRRQTDLKEGVV